LSQSQTRVQMKNFLLPFAPGGSALFQMLISTRMASTRILFSKAQQMLEVAVNGLTVRRKAAKCDTYPSVA
jgi:hypothetical protein